MSRRKVASGLGVCVGGGFSSLVVLISILLTTTTLVRAQSPITVLSNVVISFQNDGTKTQFNVSSPQTGVTMTNSWIGIGFDTNQNMVNLFFPLYKLLFLQIMTEIICV